MPQVNRDAGLGTTLSGSRSPWMTGQLDGIRTGPNNHRVCHAGCWPDATINQQYR